MSTQATAISKSSFQEEPTQRIDWETPQSFFGMLNREFNFTLDVCASESNAKCARYFSTVDDGLAQLWTGACWMNPPYGRNIIDKWLLKARDSAKAGATVVCLIPNRSDNKWWELCIQGQIRFIRGRIRFVGAPSGAKFPSVVVVFYPNLEHAGTVRIIGRK